MSLDFITHDMWLYGLVFQAVLALLLLYKRIWRRFPIFTGYCLFVFANSAGFYLVGQRYVDNPVYIVIYWAQEAGAFILGFGVVYEVFRKLFKPYAALRRLAAASFFWTLIGLLLFGALVGWLQSSPHRSGFIAAILVAHEAVRIVEVGLLMFLFVFSRAFGLHWKQSVFGIALGLAVYTAVELAAMALRVKYGRGVTPVFNVVRTGSFNLSLAAWIGYLMVPEKVAALLELPSRSELEQWNQAVKELIYE